MSHLIKSTPDFRKQFGKLPTQIQQRFQRQIQSVAKNPYGIGKPLGFRWVRELKNNTYRIYYLVYDDVVVVLLVGVSDKKSQQSNIDFIKRNMDLFRALLEEMLRNNI